MRIVLKKCAQSQTLTKALCAKRIFWLWVLWDDVSEMHKKKSHVQIQEWNVQRRVCMLSVRSHVRVRETETSKITLIVRGGGAAGRGGYPENVCRNDEAFLRQEAVMGKEGRGFDSRTVTPRLKCVNQKRPPVLPDLTRPNSKKGSPLKRSRAYFRHHQGSRAPSTASWRHRSPLFFTAKHVKSLGTCACLIITL